MSMCAEGGMEPAAEFVRSTILDPLVASILVCFARCKTAPDVKIFFQRALGVGGQT